MKMMVESKELFFAEVGSGRPVVLVHGYPLNHTLWDPQMLGLASAAQVLAPDLWGFGESQPVAQADVGTYADLVRALLDERGINEPVVIGGLSMGGYVVFEFFRRYANRVAGIILANTKAGPDSAEGKAGRDQSAALAREKGVAAITAAMLPKLLAPVTYGTSPELVARVEHMLNRSTEEGIVAALGAMRDRPDSTPTLQWIDRPTLVIAGDDDQLFPQTEPRKMAGEIRGARLEMLPAAGHLSNLEQPELFNRAVREFLSGL